MSSSSSFYGSWLFLNLCGGLPSSKLICNSSFEFKFYFFYKKLKIIINQNDSHYMTMTTAFDLDVLNWLQRSKFIYISSLRIISKVYFSPVCSKGIYWVNISTLCLFESEWMNSFLCTNWIELDLFHSILEK